MNRNLLYLERNVLLQISKYSNVAKKQTPAEYCMELVRYIVIINRNDERNLLILKFCSNTMITIKQYLFIVLLFNILVYYIKQ